MVNTTPSSIDNNDRESAEDLLSDANAQNELIGGILEEIVKLEYTQEEDDLDDEDATMSIASTDDPEVRLMNTKDVAKLELGETEEIRTSQLQKLRVFIFSKPQFKPCIDEDKSFRLNDESNEQVERFLLRFLRCNKFNVSKAAAMIEGYLKMRQSSPHWHTGLGNTSELANALDLISRGYFFVAPGRDKIGRKVIINIAGRLDANKHSASDMMKCVMMTVETLLMMDEETQVRGISYVFDCRGLTLNHVKLWKPTDAAKMFKNCEKNVPLRHRTMYISSTPFGMGAVIEFVKSFLSAKVKGRIHVIHSCHEVALHSNELLNDADVLPTEFIDERGTMTAAEMGEKWQNVVLDHSQHLQSLDELQVISDSDCEAEVVDASSHKKWFNFWS